MTVHRHKRILAELSADEFVGRTRELEAIMEHVHTPHSRTMNVISSPGLGATEFLRQVYDRLFLEASSVIPVYFEFRQSDRTAAQAAQRFARAFFAQTVAFRRHDASLIASPLEATELFDLASPSDVHWMLPVAELCGNIQSSLRSCFSGPARALAAGTQVVVLLDALEKTLYLDGGEGLLKDLDEGLSASSVTTVFAFHRRFVGAHKRRAIELEPFPLNESRDIAVALSAKLGIETNEQTRDLLAVQLQGNPARIVSVFEAAAGKNSSLNSFRQVSSVYANDILAGSTGSKFDLALHSASPDPTVRTRTVEFLHASLISAPTKTPTDVWKKMFGLTDERFTHLIEILDVEELIQLTANTISVDPANLAYCDWIKTRYLLTAESRSAAAVEAELVTESLKRAPRLMARAYRRSSSLGLKQVLAQFNCQSVPFALFDYGTFRDTYKGRDHKEIVTALADDVARKTLPEIVFVDDASLFYAPIADAIEGERAVVGTGFGESRYTDDDQIAWLVAEIDSKLEADPELVHEWCSRLEMAAESSGFARWQIWLIAPEGFTPEALDLLAQRQAFGSSRQQAILLNRFLDPTQSDDLPSPSDEYEIVVPMGDDTELIAAHAVEEVARRHHFPQKAINQIKTALVEACINAVEHSLSPDRKIYQKFAVDNNKIDITVSNRGIRLADVARAENTPSGGRRGWGLSLMKGLMDEVRIEHVDDGTRIRMRKFLKAQEN
ncbi:MAG: ATP-binding protein [Acidobacteriota bacterium]